MIAQGPWIRKLVGVALAALAFGCAEPADPEAEPADGILLISIDTLRADRLHAYGYERKTSPALDRMAREGVRFADVTAPSSWTLPSHATMLTGLDPTHHGVVAFGADAVLPAAVATVAERFRAAGFRTAAFVGGGFVAPEYGFERGFEHFFNSDQKYEFPGRLKSQVRRVKQWLERNGEARFFLFLHTYQVHMPYTPPVPYDRMFDPGIAGTPHRSLNFADLQTWGSEGARNVDFVRQASTLYDAEIAYTDRLIGELLDHLRTTGLAQRMCVLVTSDHGEEFGEHGDLFHDRAKLNQELTAVPLLVWCPGRVAGGRVVAEPVGGVDIVPTLLELAGLPVPAELDGLSLVPQIRGDAAPGPALSARVLESDVDTSVEFRFGDVRAPDLERNPGLVNEPRNGFVLALRKGRYKLVYDSNRGSRRLFDLLVDPAEREDVAAARPDVIGDFEPHLAAAIARRRALPEPGAARAVAKDSRLREELRALGYVE